MTNPLLKVGVRYALVLVVFQVIVGALAVVTVKGGLPFLAVAISTLSFVAFIVILVMAHNRLEKENGPMSFGQAIGIGLVIIILSNVTSAVVMLAVRQMLPIENPYEGFGVSQTRLMVSNMLMGFGVNFAVLLIVVLIEAQWRIYTKAGKEGWASIVPFYNIIVLLEIVKKPTIWFVLLIIPFVNIIFAVWVINLLAKRFGKDEGYTVGLLLLPFIFYPLLAFSNATYNNGELPS